MLMASYLVACLGMAPEKGWCILDYIFQGEIAVLAYTQITH